jgi:5-methylcytosine-specific restriction endonuclease McrA
MRRHRRLRQRAPLRRRTPLKSVPLAARVDQLTRQTVLERDGFCCIVCGSGGWLHPHHRVPLGRGGTSDPLAHSPVNLLSVCPLCHDRIHFSSPTQARQLGHLVRRGVDPAAIPVFTVLRGLVFLTADGWCADAADVELGVMPGVA